MPTDEEKMGMSNEEFKAYEKERVVGMKAKIRVTKQIIQRRQAIRQGVISKFAKTLRGLSASSKRKRKIKVSKAIEKKLRFKRYLIIAEPTKRVFDPIGDQTQNYFFRKKKPGERESYLGKI